MKKVKFKKLNDRAVLPEYMSETAAGLDLYLTDDIIVDGNVKMGLTGLAVEIPEGYFGMMVQRSSLAKKGVQLANSIGIIDSDYRGELMIPLITYKKKFGIFTKNTKLEAGDRVAQLLILPCVALTVKKQFVTEEAKELSDTKRGTGGFGSTGTKTK